MVDRQEVEALLEVVRGGTEQVCDRLGVAPGHTVYAVEVDTLAALCRAWLAVEEAPEAVVECNDAKGAWLIAADDTPLSEGQHVRIVKEVG